MRLYQRLLMLASVCLTAIVGALVVSPSAMAAPPAAGYYMWVNSAYPTKCLSANSSTPPGGGAGTYMVYLTTCNKNTKAQWWKMPHHGDWSTMMRNYYPSRCLSTNFSTPKGGAAGTHAAYTTACATSYPHPNTHYWMANNSSNRTGSPYWDLLENSVKLADGYWCLSATSSNPYSGGTYRVYTTLCKAGKSAQIWRPWQP
jgi:hypothetical protein